jgi:hypothetical protein
MKVEAGKYYRTRGGDVVGPMRLRDHATDPWYTNLSTWKEDGRIWSGNGWHDLDLIAEVYVSDTPPAVQETEAKWRARLLAAGPGPFIEVHDRKTLRDEFAIAIVMALLSRPLSDNDLTPERCKMVWDNATAMMGARKK